MVYTIKKEQTGLNNYVSPFNCSLACALKNAGYTDVIVSGYDIIEEVTWSAKKDNKSIRGIFSRKISDLAWEAASRVSQTDITFTV